MIDSLYLEDSVKLLGYHTDLEKYVNSCDLVVSASKREGLPLNIVEAMMCKKAVVVSDNRGHRELVDDGRNGYIVPADSIEAFAEKIKHLYENAAIRETFAIEGKQKAELYTMKHVTSELEIVYLK